MQTHRLRPSTFRVFTLLIASLSVWLLPANQSLNGPASTQQVGADDTTQSIPFSQNWSSAGLISANDNWGGVPGIVGFRGDNLTTVTSTDPQTIVADGSGTPIDVIANQANPNTQTSGGVAEFDGIANPVVALQGSGTASAPHVVMSINTTGLSAIKVAYNLRDIDGSADNAVQPVALQFRVGASGSYTNIPAGFVSDASTGPNLATQVTQVSATLPAAADNQPLVQIRIITTDANGSDEWIGIDDILIFVPSLAKLDSFSATRHDDGKVLLKWRTGFEVDNLGFNVFREQNGSRLRINSEMIAGSALRVGEGTMLRSGYSYSWPDEQPGGEDVGYWLEAIDLTGRSTMFGPVSAGASEVYGRVPSKSGRTVSLSSLGRKGAAKSSSKPLARTAAAPPTATLRGSDLPIAAMRPALKLSVDREGWYRVTQQELTSAGFDPALDPRLLQLFAEGVEQAITVEGQANGRVNATDGIEFYGIGLDTPLTNTRVYWLVAGEKPGLRIKSASAKGSKAALSGFAHTVERRDQTVYFSSLRNGDKENFFGAVIARSPVSQSLTTHHIDRESTEDAILEVTLQGVTAGNHRVAVGFNGSDLGEVVFAAMQQGSARLSVQRGAIREGQNVVTLTSTQGEGDVSIVDSLRLTYRHGYRADDDALRFTAKGKRVLAIEGFTRPTIRVVDVTDPAAPIELKTNIEQRESGYTVTVRTPKGGERVLMAFTGDQIKRPVSVIADQPSNLKDESRAADLIVVTRGEFIPAFEPLVRLRESQGLRVALVDVEDIYDEFNHGEKSATAVKDFFAHAHARWSKPPRFVLLAGDASLDPKNHLGLGAFDLVPTRLVDTILMETASDDWFVDFDGDGLGELALGRLPARAADDVSLWIGKILTYESATADGVLFVSDSNDGIDFEAGTERVRRLVPDSIRVEEIVRGRLDDGETKKQIVDNVRHGPSIVSYFGHGSVDLWRGGILTSSDATVAGSDVRPSIFLLITCLNGYFQDPALDSLAESLLKTKHGGAAAVWASSGMCGADEQLVIYVEMFRLMFNSSSSSELMTLGEAVLKAKAVTVESDVRKTYILFGDPSSRLR